MTKQFKPWAFPANAIHVALDLETASTNSDAAIVQLAAVASLSCLSEPPPAPGVTTRKVTPPLEFDEYISLISNEVRGRHISKETMEWWNTQDSVLRRRVFGGTQDLSDVLERFHGWALELADDDLNRIVLWGNGTEFDNVILQNAFEQFATWPFHYRNNHHMRTLLTTVPQEVQERAHNRFMALWPENVHHDALHDARYQHAMIVAGLKYHGLY